MKRRRTERKSRTQRGTEEALRLTNRSRESHAPPTVNTCFSKILHHQWVYQHVCVHQLNKGNKKMRTCPPPQKEPNIWALMEPPKKKTLTVLSFRRSSESLLELKHRHVGLVGLCNCILHTAVYRLFSRGDATGIFKRGRESLVISPRV